MSKKRVIVYVMHENEVAEAHKVVSEPEETESFVIGEVEESDIDNLREQGLIVQVLDEEEFAGGMKKEDLRADVAAMKSHATFAQQRVWTEREAKDVPHANISNVYLIQLTGPLIDKRRAGLEAMGVKLLESVPPYSFTAKLTPDKIQQVNVLPFVKRMRLYDSTDTMEYRQVATERHGEVAAPPAKVVGTSMLTYDVRLHSAEDAATVHAWLEKHNVAVAGARREKFRIYAMEGSPVIEELAMLPEVAIIEEYVPPELHNDVARNLLGIDPDASGNPTQPLPFTGQGEIIGVADTGLDDTHPDFQGRIVRISPLGRPGDASDPDGHGTHVAGSVLGNGSSSSGQIRGTAPDAQLFFQSLLDVSGGLGGLPLHLEDLFDEAYQSGARIHNNSWGAATDSRYTMNSIEVDEFVAEHRDMLVVISAGNEGAAANPRNSNTGFVDWLSIGSPASSKNSLTVGASRSDRSGVGYSNLTYGAAWPADFPDDPIASELVSGDTEALAAFSSRGPCDDRRIKPDLVAPGTDIASTKSSRAPLRNFWGVYPGNPRYAYNGGTSMSAPLVAGCAALVREYYRTQRNHSPSAALLKATLINSTRWLTATDSRADHNTSPNFHQGFGALYMPWAIPNANVPDMNLEYIDNWQDPASHLQFNGARRRYHFHVDAGTPLRICLTWTDPPGRALQHDLNLFLHQLGTTTKWIGNTNLPLKISLTDPENNVEIIRVDNPVAGDYMVLISALNLLHGPQDFALVVTGAVSALTAI